MSPSASGCTSGCRNPTWRVACSTRCSAPPCGKRSRTSSTPTGSRSPAASSSGSASLDPISTAKIEELIDELKDDYTIAIVTHNMQQAARVSDFTAFMYLGELLEYGETTRMFTTPNDRRTQDYITGRFG